MTRDQLAFGAVGIASLFLLSFVDDATWSLAMRHAPRLAFVGHYRLASLVVCLALTMALVGRAAFRLPSGVVPWRAVAVVAGAWTIGTAVSVLVLKVWTPTLGFEDAGDYVAFLGTGLLGEELLFRGVLFHLGARVLPDSPTSRLGPVVWTTAALFALSHAQYHGFRASGAALAQMAYTLPMGVVFAFVRKHTRSLWPGVGVHLACNLLSVVRVWLG